MALSLTTANEIADYLLWLAQNERPDEPLPLTPMQLQKLLYFAQGWALHEWNQPLFQDRIEGWRDGPVVESVYQRFKYLGKRPITSEREWEMPSLGDAERDLVNQVWDVYKKYSAWSMSDMTHDDPAWINSRRGRTQSAQARSPISFESMKRSFGAKASETEQRLSQNWNRLADFARRNTQRLTGRDSI